VLAEGPGEPAEGTATTRSGRLTFESADSSHAQPGLIGQSFLGQAALAAQLAQALAVEDERLRLGRAGDGRDRL
jgi:hypothetical protein